MLYILSAIAVCSIVFALLMLRKANELSRNNLKLRAVIDHQDTYTLLVNSDFEVETSNLPGLETERKNEHHLLGNVLHCKNAHDHGRCGESMACHSCLLRFVITKSFERGRDFSGIEASMEVYDKRNNLVDVDVQVGGHYIDIGKQGHMIVNVKDVSGGKCDERPKILFVTENVALYDRMKDTLDKDYRILYADNEHQAFHRMQMAAAYKFRAVFTDETFYREHEDVLKMIVKTDRIPVLVFVRDEKFEKTEGVGFVSPTTKKENILTMLSSLSA